MTLTWEGDDDLDLAVDVLDGERSVRIDYYNAFDEDSGGSFDTLFSQDVYAPHLLPHEGRTFRDLQYYGLILGRKGFPR